MALRTENNLPPISGGSASNRVIQGGQGELLIRYGGSLANSVPLDITLRKSSFPIYLDAQSDTSIQALELVGGGYFIDRIKTTTDPTGVKFFTSGEEARETATFQLLSGGGKVVIHETAGSPFEGNILTEGVVIGLDELSYPINFPANVSITILQGAWINTGAGAGSATTLQTGGSVVSGVNVHSGQGVAEITGADGDKRKVRLSDIQALFQVEANESLELLGNAIAFTTTI